MALWGWFLWQASMFSGCLCERPCTSMASDSSSWHSLVTMLADVEMVVSRAFVAAWKREAPSSCKEKDPEEDGGMVPIARHHGRHALHEGCVVSMSSTPSAS